MSDERLRELERRWHETGSVHDEAALLHERVRAGELAGDRLVVAATCGHEAARLALATQGRSAPTDLFTTVEFDETDDLEAWLEVWAARMAELDADTVLEVALSVADETVAARNRESPDEHVVAAAELLTLARTFVASRHAGQGIQLWRRHQTVNEQLAALVESTGAQAGDAELFALTSALAATNLALDMSRGSVSKDLCEETSAVMWDQYFARGSLAPIKEALTRRVLRSRGSGS